MSDRERAIELAKQINARYRSAPHVSNEKYELILVARELLAQSAKIKELEQELYGGVHSCHNNCSKPACKLRRERDDLKEKLGKAVKALKSCDVALKAAKPCMNGGEHMNERIAEEAIKEIEG